MVKAISLGILVISLHGVSETTSSRGLAITDLLFSAFQMMFSIICVAILTGSVVGRMRFTPLAIFIVFGYFWSIILLHIWYGETEFLSSGDD